MSTETLKSSGDTIRDRLIKAARECGGLQALQIVASRDKAEAELAAASKAFDEWVRESRELLERLRDFVVSVDTLLLPRDMAEGEQPFGTIDYMGMEQLRDEIDAILKPPSP